MKTTKYAFFAATAALLLALPNHISAQDIRFSQPYANPLSVNPALMGMNDDLKFTMHYRNQWGVLDKGFTTYAFTALYPIFMNEGKQKLDFGLNVINDKAGAFNNLDLSLAAGYNLRISSSGYINVSILGGYSQRSLGTGNLTFDEQYVLGSYNSANPNTETTLNQKKGFADAGAGLMWYYNPSRAEGAKINAFLGASAYHLASPNESFVQSNAVMPKRYTLHGGIKMLGEGKIDFTPNVIVHSQAGTENIAVGVLMDYRMGEKSKLTLGAWYRKKDAMAFSVGVEVKAFAITYSYDVPTTQLRGYVSKLNANELSLSLKFNQKKDKTASLF